MKAHHYMWKCQCRGQDVIDWSYLAPSGKGEIILLISVFSFLSSFIGGFPMKAQLVKNPPARWETLVQFLGQEDPSTGEGISYPLQPSWASLVAQLVKNLPAMREAWARSLGWEDPLDSPRGHKESDTTERLSLLFFTLGWGGFPSSSAVKNPPAMQELQETRIWSLSWEETLQENMATQYSCLKNPMDRGAW